MSQTYSEMVGRQGTGCCSGWMSGERLLLGVVMLLLASTLPPFPGSLIIIGLMAGLARFSGRWGQLKWRPWFEVYWRAVIVPATMALLGALTVAVRFRFRPLPGIELDDPGVAVDVLFRSLAGTATLGYLVLSLTIGDLTRVLRWGGLPDLQVELIATTARFGTVLVDTARTMRDSQVARAGYDTSSAAHRSVSMLVATLFVTAIERARRLEIAVTARGGEGEWRIATPRAEISRPALVAIAGLAVTVTLVSLVSTMVWGGRP